MNRPLHRTVSTILIVMFGFFSVGVPVVQYLCPMMDSENPTCDMSPTAKSAGITFSSQTPSCCAKQLGAERNKTPFLKAEKNQTVSLDASIVAVADVDIASFEPSSSSINPVILGSSPPIFLLHSALLI